MSVVLGLDEVIYGPVVVAMGLVGDGMCVLTLIRLAL